MAKSLFRRLLPIVGVFGGFLNPMTGAAGEQNLLLNPGFESGLDRWILIGPVNYEAVWDARDAAGSTCSGSALALHRNPVEEGFTVLHQCANGVHAGQSIEFGVKSLFPGGQATTVSTYTAILFYPELNCSGTPVGTQFGTFSDNSSSEEVWVTSSDSLVAPPGSVSAALRLGISKSFLQDARAHFDDAFLRHSDVSAYPMVEINPENISDTAPHTLTILANFPTGLGSVTQVQATYNGVDVTALLVPYVTEVHDTGGTIVVPNISFPATTRASFVFSLATTAGRAFDSLCVDVAR
jgi:hypothetical protein